SRFSSSAWPVPYAKQYDDQAGEHGAKPQRLPIGQALIEQNVDGRSGEQCRSGEFGRAASPHRRRNQRSKNEKRHRRGRERRKRKIAVAGIKYETERHYNGEHREQH